MARAPAKKEVEAGGEQIHACLGYGTSTSFGNLLKTALGKCKDSCVVEHWTGILKFQVKPTLIKVRDYVYTNRKEMFTETGYRLNWKKF